MSECIVLDARRDFIHASQTIPEGKCSPPQARQDEGLGWPVVGGRTQEVEGARPRQRNGKGRSRGHDGGHPEAHKRGCRPNAEAAVHIRRLPRRGLHADVSSEMEGVNTNDN